MFRQCNLAVLLTKGPFKRKRGRASDFFVRVKICASRRFRVARLTINACRGLTNCAPLHAIFLNGNQVLRVLTSRLRRLNLAAKRLKRLLCRVRGLFEFQFNLHRRLFRINSILTIFLIVAFRINGKSNGFHFHRFYLTFCFVLIPRFLVLFSSKDNGLGKTFRYEQQ